jgi:hypothetical protein
MNNVITTINRPSSIKVLFLGNVINVKPAKNSKDSMPKLNAYAVPALISAPGVYHAGRIKAREAD